MQWARSPYIFRFPCSYGKIFWWDRSGKFKNTRRKGTGQENSKKEKEKGKNGGKKKEEIFFTTYIRGGSHTRVFSIGQECPSGYRPHATLPQESPLGCSPSVRNALQGYRPRATLPQESPLVWEPPLQPKALQENPWVYFEGSWPLYSWTGLLEKRRDILPTYRCKIPLTLSLRSKCKEPSPILHYLGWW